MCIGIGDSLVNVVFVCIFRRAGIGIAERPKTLDELVPRVVSREVEKCIALFLGDEVDDVAVEPFAIRRRKILLAYLLRASRAGNQSAEHQCKRKRERERYVRRETNTPPGTLRQRVKVKVCR